MENLQKAELTNFNKKIFSLRAPRQPANASMNITAPRTIITREISNTKS